MKFLTPKKDLEFLGEYKRVVGIDEAGRGCWAGPVHVAGFVIETPKYIRGVNDSKLIAPKVRENLHLKLSKLPHFLAPGSVQEINSYGLVKTVERKIQEIIDHFESTYSDQQTYYLIDGKFSKNFGNRSIKVIRGDSTYYSIAAASIIAKVSRDAYMKELSNQFPDFKFDLHKGYGTKLHSSVLVNLGPTSIHRLNFRPVQQVLMLKSVNT